MFVSTAVYLLTNTLSCRRSMKSFKYRIYNPREIKRTPVLNSLYERRCFLMCYNPFNFTIKDIIIRVFENNQFTPQPPWAHCESPGDIMS